MFTGPTLIVQHPHRSSKTSNTAADRYHASTARLIFHESIYLLFLTDLMKKIIANHDEFEFNNTKKSVQQKLVVKPKIRIRQLMFNKIYKRIQRKNITLFFKQCRLI